MSSILSILQYGLSVALVGIGTVFVGLVILIGLIKVMELAVSRVGTGKKQAAAQPAPAPVAAPAVVEEEPQQDEDELIAVIAAAVAVAMEASDEQEEATGFVVRSIRRINNAPAWNRAGREEQVYSRM